MLFDCCTVCETVIVVASLQVPSWMTKLCCQRRSTSANICARNESTSDCRTTYGGYTAQEWWVSFHFMSAFIVICSNQLTESSSARWSFCRPSSESIDIWYSFIVCDIVCAIPHSYLWEDARRPIAQKPCILGQWLLQNTNRKPHTGSWTHLSLWLYGHWGGQNGNEAVTGSASEAFAGWLHHQCSPVELPSVWENTFHFMIVCVFIARFAAVSWFRC